jgi:hypothetical protein
MDDEDLVEVAIAYTSRHALEVRELLGSGIHGNRVFENQPRLQELLRQSAGVKIAS